jgi:hypothetical protein
MTPLPWVYDDGGRRESGFRGDTGDCVTRAIAIATGLPYADVYRDVSDRVGATGRARSARNGVPNRTIRPLITGYGFTWTPTMKVGAGTTVHVSTGEVPDNCILRLSRHVVAVVDGVVHDTYDPSRDGTRAVYGYFVRSEHE